MILDDVAPNPSITSSALETHTMKMVATAKSFEILSTLYGNAIRAIIRELCCNAYDSHVAVGKADVPFELHLPTALAPYLSIKDFGLGLSKSEIIDICGTFFESTKTNSDDFIGALGLGMKSPLAYRNAGSNHGSGYTIIGIKDGWKTHVHAHINKVGEPSFTVLSHHETSEENGVEVKMGVNREDFHRFIREAASTLRPFPVKPNLTGAPVEWDTLNIEHENVCDGVSVMAGDNNYYHSRTIIVMGNIEYPVNVSMCDNLTTSEGNLLRQYPLLIEAPLGAVHFQPSREELKYTEKTCAFIQEKAKSFLEYQLAWLTAQLEDIDNFWELNHEMSELYTSNGGIWRYVLDSFKRNNPERVTPQSDALTLESRGVPIAWPDKLTSSFDFNITQYQVERNVSKVQNGNMVRAASFSKEVERDSKGNFTSREYFTLPSNQKTIILVDDTQKPGAIKRTREHFKNISLDHPEMRRAYRINVILLRPNDQNKQIDVEAVKEKLCGYSNFMMVSELSEVVHKPKSPKSLLSTDGVQVLRFNVPTVAISRHDFLNVPWDVNHTFNGVNDADKTFYYIPLSGYSVNSHFKGKIDNPKELIYYMGGLGLLNMNYIYGIRLADIEKVQQQKNWINVEELIVDAFKKPTVERYAMLCLSERDRILSTNLEYISKDKIKDIKQKDSPVLKMIKSVGKSPTLCDVEYAVRRLGENYCKNKKLLEKNLKMLSDGYAETFKLKERYGLLIHNVLPLSTVVQYINMVDFYFEHH